jgi:hypothetical protein
MRLLNFLIKIAILLELVILNLTWSAPISHRHLNFGRNQNETRNIKIDLTNETLMSEKEFFKIFNTCVKECLKLKRAIQRDKCLASVCDIY